MKYFEKYSWAGSKSIYLHDWSLILIHIKIKWILVSLALLTWIVFLVTGVKFSQFLTLIIYLIKFYNIFKFQYDIRWKHFETSIFLVFSFFLLDLPFLVHPSIILWLILKIKINEFFGCFLQLAKLQRQNYFLEPCIYFLSISFSLRRAGNPLKIIFSQMFFLGFYSVNWESKRMKKKNLLFDVQFFSFFRWEFLRIYSPLYFNIFLFKDSPWRR